MKKKNILIAEDSVFSQMFIEEFVKLLDQDYTFVNNGQEVIDILGLEKFDIILMDIEMPIMDGIKATKIIRKDMDYPNSQIPIIALTAYKEIYSKEELLEIGINDFILKPFTFDKFNKIVRKYLASPEETISSIMKDTNYISKSKERLYNLNYIHDFTGGDSEFIHEMVKHFINNTPVLINKIKNIPIENNWESFLTEVKKLKPAFLFLGIEQINSEFSRLESLVENKKPQHEINPMITDIETKSAQIIETLKIDFNIN